MPMAKPALILRPTVIGGDRLKDDYCVHFEGRNVGRIRLAGRESGWAWCINPPPRIGAGNGALPLLPEYFRENVRAPCIHCSARERWRCPQ
jgi:hypothetical protein